MTLRRRVLAGIALALTACGKGNGGSASATPKPSLAAILSKIKLPEAPVEDEGECSAEHPGGSKAAAKKIRATEPAKAAALFTIGCDGGSSGSCVELGSMRLRGADGAPKDGERARELYTRACAGNNPWGCHNLGVLLLQELMVDDALGAEAYALGCEGAVIESCHALGNAYEFGRGVMLDVPQAEKLYQKGCDASLGRSCTALGRLVRDGSAKKTERSHRDLFQMGCDLNDGDGCALAGTYVMTPAEVLARYEKGCDLKSAAACSKLGAYFSDGTFVPKDPARAIAADDKGCAYGAGECCVRARQTRAAASVPIPPTPAPTGSAAP